MKQTNNAIKFLMAQYRAIFKNAYLKGMASAVLLTAGLAAGAAQAATTENISEATTYTSPFDSSTPITDEVVIGGEDGSGNIFINNATLGNGGVITNSGVGANAGSSGALYLSGTLTIDGGSIELNSVSGQTAFKNVGGIADWDGSTNATDYDAALGASKATSAIILKDGSIDVHHSSIQVGAIILEGGEATVGGNISNDNNWGGNSNLVAASSGSAGGVFSASNTTLNLEDGSIAGGKVVSISNSQLNFTGTADMGSKGSAVLYVNTPSDDTNSSMNFGAGANINVATGHFGTIIAEKGNEVSSTTYHAEVSFNSGSTITVDNDATLSMGLAHKRTDTFGEYAVADIKGAPTFDFNNGAVINNSGTVRLIANNGDLSKEAGAASGGVVFTFNTGSTLNNIGADSIFQIEDGNKVVLDGGQIISEGTIDVQQGGRAIA